jgi:hypothetical protein
MHIISNELPYMQVLVEKQNKTNKLVHGSFLSETNFLASFLTQKSPKSLERFKPKVVRGMRF